MKAFVLSHLKNETKDDLFLRKIIEIDENKKLYYND